MILRVKTLESLGAVVNGDYVENYGHLFKLDPTAIIEKVKALEAALDPGCFLKLPILLGVKTEDIARRMQNLQVILGEHMARDRIGKDPRILLSREATVKELMFNLTNTFPKSEVLARIRMTPSILGRN